MVVARTFMSLVLKSKMVWSLEICGWMKITARLLHAGPIYMESAKGIYGSVKGNQC